MCHTRNRVLEVLKSGAQHRSSNTSRQQMFSLKVSLLCFRCPLSMCGHREHNKYLARALCDKQHIYITFIVIYLITSHMQHQTTATSNNAIDSELETLRLQFIQADQRIKILQTQLSHMRLAYDRCKRSLDRYESETARQHQQVGEIVIRYLASGFDLRTFS